MKMNKRTWTFARQVQVDLLALPDTDLIQVIHQWVNGDRSDPDYSVSEGTLSALGYTLEVDGPYALSLNSQSEYERSARGERFAPAPERLRELLTEMDVKLFVEHVLPLAFQTLHAAHPEWDEGATFNAHLANHLRRMSTKR